MIPSFYSEVPNILDNMPKSKLALLEILGTMQCAKCGYFADWRALEIDHKYGKAHGIDPNRSTKYYLDNPDIAYEELQILCANCHRVKTWYDKKGIIQDD